MALGIGHDILGPLQGLQKTKYSVWIFLVHYTRKIKAVVLLVLLVGTEEDDSVKGI